MTDAAMVWMLLIDADRTPQQYRDACAALDTCEGIEAFRRGLADQGRLADALLAIEARLAQIKRGRG